MVFIERVAGKIVYGVARTLEISMEVLIQLLATLVVLTKNIGRGCATFISMGGCLFVIFMVGPFGMAILTSPWGFFTIAFLILFPILGARFAVYLKYLKYITTEYLYNLANYLQDGANYQYKPFQEYKIAYQKAEKERMRREQESYNEQQRQWEERMKQQRQQWEQSFWGRQGDYYGGQWNFGSNYINPNLEFKNKYENSCEVLGVPYDADRDQVRMAYRKKAKEYHPDLNKAPTAAQMFNEITNAYEFLSEENIQKYKNN